MYPRYVTVVDTVGLRISTGSRNAFNYCGRDGGIPNGRLYDWEGVATMGMQSPEVRWVESFL